jgi:hypothetical protein
VGRDRRQIPSRPEGLRPIAAAFAVFALLIQALLPSAAMAAQGAAQAAGAPLVVCTIAGAQRLDAAPAPQHSPKGLAGMPCQDCLAASVAALAPPVLALGAVPIAFVVVEHHARPAVRLALARAPPRPFGQGPPAA